MANEEVTTGFILTCQSCAAKLRVTRPNLVGQMLACPKCGTMLKIIPPPGFNPLTGFDSSTDLSQVPKTASGLKKMPLAPATEVKTVLTTSDFEEIELLLQTNPELAEAHSSDGSPKFRPVAAPTQKANPTASPGATSTTTRDQRKSAHPVQPLGKKTGSATAPAQADPTTPLLPNDEWVSAATRKRKQMTALLACGIGLIVILSTVVIALLNGFGTKSRPPVAHDQPTPLTGNDADPPSDNSVENSQGKTGVKEDIPANNSEPSSSSEGIVQNSNPETQLDVNSSLTNENPPVSVENGEPPPVLIGENNDEPPPVLPGTTESNDSVTTQPSPDQARTPVNSALPDLSDDRNRGSSANTQADMNSSLSNLDRLSQLVEGAQVPTGRLRDLATQAQEEQRVGIRQFLIEKNFQPRPEVAKQLAIPCESLEYNSVPLSMVLYDQMMIIGVPISVDLDSVLAQHLSSNPPVSLELRNTDFANAIDAIAQSVEMVAEPTSNQSLVFYAANRGELVEASYDLPDFNIKEGEIKSQVIEEFRSVIVGMVYPDSWKLELNPSRLEILDTKITVINTPTAQRAVQGLIQKFAAAATIARNPNSAEAWETLQTLSSRVNKKMEQPSGLDHRFAEPLLETLTTLSSTTGLTIYADWEKLAPLGWHPTTSIPGTIAGGDLRFILSELSKAMGITYIAIDEQTILLTSFEGAAQRSEIEIYPFQKILAGKITEPQALTVLKNSLATELGNPQVRMYFDPRIKCLIVSAPQLVQNKVGAIVAALQD